MSITKGKWEVVDEKSGVYIRSDNGAVVAENLKISDAELIAVAPDLFDRLKISTVQMHVAVMSLKNHKANKIYYADLEKTIEFNEAVLAKVEK